MGLDDGTGEVHVQTDPLVDHHVDVGTEVHAVLLVVGLVPFVVRVPEGSLADDVEGSEVLYPVAAARGVDRDALQAGGLAHEEVSPVGVGIEGTVASALEVVEGFL